MGEQEPVSLEALDDAAQLVVAAVVGAGSAQVYAESGAAGLIGFIIPILLTTFVLLFAYRWVMRKWF